MTVNWWEIVKLNLSTTLANVLLQFIHQELHCLIFPIIFSAILQLTEH